MTRGFTALDEDLARLLVGEPSFSELSSRLLAILKIKEPLFAADYDRLHQRIAHVNEVRRWVAHKPFVGQGDNLIFSNIIVAKSQGAIKGYVCTTTQLDNLARLTTRLNNAVVAIKPESTSTPANFRKIVDELLAFSKTLDLPPSPDHKPPQSPPPKGSNPKKLRPKRPSR